MIGPKTPKPSPADEKRAYQQMTERDQNRCVRCGAHGVQRDHRQNRQTGNTVVANLQGLCPACHEWKTINPAEAMRDGYAVPRWADWSFWPAWRVDVRSFVLYLDVPDSQGRWWTEITAATASLLTHGEVG
ncbi:HNH endonuclease signature motif containing protein [Microbacterium sp. KR10-403]|uniref:HNH endonuclease n=1 Tax=Microbacterium sp. KR10-403 TaxID=3158581 RepID=UPI0032E41B76